MFFFRIFKEVLSCQHPKHNFCFSILWISMNFQFIWTIGIGISIQFWMVHNLVYLNWSRRTHLRSCWHHIWCGVWRYWPLIFLSLSHWNILSQNSQKEHPVWGKLRLVREELWIFILLLFFKRKLSVASHSMKKPEAYIQGKADGTTCAKVKQSESLNSVFMLRCIHKCTVG